MSVSGEKVLRGIQIGTRAGWLALAGLAGFLIWRYFSPAAQKKTDLLNPVPPSPDLGAPPDLPMETPPGVSAGTHASALIAEIIDPGENGEVSRRPLRSVFPVTIQVANNSNEDRAAQLNIVADFYEWTGGQRLGIHTLLKTETIRARTVSQIQAEIESGNTDMLLFEFGKATAVVQVYTDQVMTQSTSFVVT